MATDQRVQWSIPAARRSSLVFDPPRPFVSERLTPDRLRIISMRRSRRQTMTKDSSRLRRPSPAGPFASTFDRGRTCLERSQQFRRSVPGHW
jgi:hypothetical protein